MDMEATANRPEEVIEMETTKTNEDIDGVVDYAAYLRQAVLDDYRDDPDRFGSCKSWTDLHDVCDANDYMQDADEHFGATTPNPFGPWPEWVKVGDPVWDERCQKVLDDYVSFTNAAIAIVEADWPIPTEDEFVSVPSC